VPRSRTATATTGHRSGLVFLLKCLTAYTDAGTAFLSSVIHDKSTWPVVADSWNSGGVHFRCPRRCRRFQKYTRQVLNRFHQDQIFLRERKTSPQRMTGNYKFRHNKNNSDAEPEQFFRKKHIPYPRSAKIVKP
jgi:hypothetical protein